VSARRGPSPLVFGTIGTLLAIIAVLIVAVALLLSGPLGGLVGASGGPGGSVGPTGSAVAVATTGPTDPGPAPSSSAGAATPDGSLAPSAGTTTAPHVTPGSTPAATAGHTTAPATPRPSATPTPKPKIDSFVSEPSYVTNCTAGTTVKLTWLTTNADRVDIAVDPQGESPLQHIYVDHQALDGYLDLAYPCSPPNQDNTGAKYHEYVVIAYRGSAYVYKSIWVFVQPQV
jgi:hypothetical protein